MSCTNDPPQSDRMVFKFYGLFVLLCPLLLGLCVSGDVDVFHIEIIMASSDEASHGLGQGLAFMGS